MDSATQKRRIILKGGEDYVVYKTQDIAYFFLQHKTIFLVGFRNGERLRVGGTLRDIHLMLDTADFYRVNKNYIVHIQAIVCLKSCDVSKVELILDPPTAEPVFISQLRTSDFREWIERSAVNDEA